MQTRGLPCLFLSVSYFFWKYRIVIFNSLELEVNQGQLPQWQRNYWNACLFNFRYHWNSTICTNRLKSDQRRTWYGNMHVCPTGDIHIHAISFSASLFIAFTIWCTFILAVNNCLSKFSCRHRRLLAHKAWFIQLRWSLGFLYHHLSFVASSNIFLSKIQF